MALAITVSESPCRPAGTPSPCRPAGTPNSEVIRVRLLLPAGYRFGCLAAAERIIAARMRRLILDGTLVEHELAENPKRRARFNSRLDAFLTRDRNRELFGLKPRRDGAETSGPPEASATVAEDERRDHHEQAQ